jgi:hypothetical protein
LFKSRSLSQEKDQRIQFSLNTELRKKLSQDRVQDRRPSQVVKLEFK